MQYPHGYGDELINSNEGDLTFNHSQLEFLDNFVSEF